MDVTLVTQSSTNRAWLLHLFCQRWQGPVAAAVSCNEQEAVNAAATISALATTAACGSLTQTRERLTLSKEGATLRRGRLALEIVKQEGRAYPINALRNAAMRLAATSHVLVLDIDFLPSIELYGSLLAQLTPAGERVALVVPAFARKGDNAFKHTPMDKWREAMLASRDPDALAPSTLASLAACVATANCIVFDSTWNYDAHATTDSAAWLEESLDHVRSVVDAAAEVVRTRPSKLGADAPALLRETTPKLRRLACFESGRYEPYVVLRRVQAPAFNETFAGYGKNKIEYIARLRYSGFAFAVLPVGFVCHCPHPLSRDKQDWLKKGRGKHATDALYKDAVNAMVATLRDHPKPANQTWLCRGTPPSAKSGQRKFTSSRRRR